MGAGSDSQTNMIIQHHSGRKVMHTNAQVKRVYGEKSRSIKELIGIAIKVGQSGWD